VIHISKKPKKENPHEGHRGRVRKRFIENGLNGFAHHEMLELLLYYCYAQQDTNEIAHKMIKEYGSLYNLFEADTFDIMNRCNVTERVAVLVSLIPKLCNVYFRSKWEREIIVMKSLNIAAQYAVSLFVGRTNEAFYIFCLDTGYRLNHVSLIAEGTLDETAIYPREIVGESIKHQATHIILAHNHPGATANPSRRDIEATRKIVEGLKFMNIRVIDHIVVAGDKYYSFASNDYMVEGYIS